MEAQSEGSAGPQQINATSLFDPNATLHARSLPPPSPAGDATPLPPPAGQLLRGHNRTHSGHVPKSNAPSSSYVAAAQMRNPFIDGDLQVESSAASDVSNASFYTAAEDGVESSGPSYADRPSRGADRPGLLGPIPGDRFGRADRPSPLGAGADRGPHPSLPPIATGNASTFSHFSQVCRPHDLVILSTLLRT